MENKFKLKEVFSNIGNKLEIKDGNKKLGHIYQGCDGKYYEVKLLNKLRYFEEYDECLAYINQIL
jgi:hypothetical protein